MNLMNYHRSPKLIVTIIHYFILLVGDEFIVCYYILYGFLICSILWVFEKFP